MPQEERPAISTPAEQRRRRGGRLFVLAAFFLVVLSGLAATVLFVNDARNYKRLVRQFGLQTYLLPPPPAPAVRIGRQRRLAANSRQLPRLVRPLAQDTARLIPPVTTSSEERCQAMTNIGGGEPPNFLAGANEWECTFFRQFGEGDDPASLFIQAKGVGDDDLRTFRIKMSFTDERQDGALLQAALTALDGYNLPLTPQSRTYLEGRLSTRTAFKSELENYRATFTPEMMDQRRFNLLLVAKADATPCGAPVQEPDRAPRRAIVSARVGCLTLPTGNAFSPEG